MTMAIDQRPALPLVQITSDQEPESTRELKNAHERTVLGMIGGVRFVEPSVTGLGPARVVQGTWRQCGNIAGERFAGKSRHEIQARPGAPGARVDHNHEPPDAALPILFGQAGNLCVDRIGDLLGDETAGIEREIAEQKRRKKPKDGQIDQRQLERGGAK
jgi:hypothetical protein